MSHTINEMRRRKPMWVYEKNYTFLIRLFPVLSYNANNEQPLAHDLGNIKVSIIECCRYTLTVAIDQYSTGQNSFADDISMIVRIYHDAKLAEVINYQGHKRMQPYHEYTNINMLHPNDKRQANILLHDWLATYISTGYARLRELACS